MSRKDREIMKKQNGKAAREKADKTFRRIWDFFQVTVGPWLIRKFDYSCVSIDTAEIDGPVLVAINHSCAYDPLLTGIPFRSKPLSFVASEHLLRMRPWGPLMERYLPLIPHRKGAKGNRTALAVIKRIRRGGSVFLAPEGEQTWDGRPMPVMPQTGGLAKACGATLVTYVLEGGYLSYPRWALYTRKGKISGHPVGIYSPEQLAAMSEEDVEAAIARDLAFDSVEWQKTRPGGPLRFIPSKGGNADGLERSVFTCPECGRMDSLRSDGDYIGCDCGFRIRLDDTGFFEQPAPFESPADWNALDREALGEALSGGLKEGTLFSDGNVTLHRINDDHSDEEAARGTLSLKAGDDGSLTLDIGDFSFDLRAIKGMTMVLAGRIVFSDKSGYYELRSEKNSRTNLRKYVIAKELLGANQGNR